MNGRHMMDKSVRDKLGVRKWEPGVLLTPMVKAGLEQIVACIYKLPNTLLRLKKRREEGSQDPHWLGLGKGSL